MNNRRFESVHLFLICASLVLALIAVWFLYLR